MTTSDELIEQARAAAEAAYAPYSKFRVGAVVVTQDGEIVRGANVENAAYGSTVCAEANAVTTAIGNGARSLTTLAVVCLDGDDCMPCGNCLQLMGEFGVKRVITEQGEYTFEELLPESFGPEALA